MFKLSATGTLELTHYAFKTSKGIFTLSATHSNGTDEWRELGTNNFHTWQRQKVYEWFKSGNIEVLEESSSIMWYLNGQKHVSKRR